MIGQEQQDYDEQPQQRGVAMSYDDLNVGDYYCVYNLKRQPDECAPIMGQSFHVKAICLPYFVVQVMTDPAKPIITLDARYLNLMKVTKEFVEAQAASAHDPQMMAPRQRKRKQEQGE